MYSAVRPVPRRKFWATTVNCKCGPPCMKNMTIIVRHTEQLANQRLRIRRESRRTPCCDG